jgi:hypothetical protein
LTSVLWTLSDTRVSPPDDFIAFWSSARLLLAGGNPYDAGELLRVERSAGWLKDHAYRVWEPPWALVGLAPLAALPYQEARFVWFLIHLALLVMAADRLWLVYGGDRARRGQAWMIGVTFAPAIIGWKTGQLTVLVLAAVVAFLELERRGRHAMAVAAFVLLASVKPHVVYLPCVGLALWIVAGQRRAGVAGLAAAALLLVGPVLGHPAVLEQFVTAIGETPPQQPAPTIGTVLRELSRATFDRDVYPLVFAAPIAGILWLLSRWRRRGAGRWEETFPLLLAVGVLTAPFAWIYDAAVLLVPVMHVVVPALRHPRSPRSRAALWSYGAIDASIFAQNVANVHPFLYAWVPAAILLWYLRFRPDASHEPLDTPKAVA